MFYTCGGNCRLLLKIKVHIAVGFVFLSEVRQVV